MSKEYGWIIEDTKIDEFVNNNYGPTSTLANARVFFTKEGAYSVKGDINTDHVHKVALDKNGKPIRIVKER